MSQNDSHEPVTVTDKRRIDPDTGEVREQATGPAPGEPAPEAGGSPQEVTELKSTLQRVKAEYDNYRKRTLRDQQVIAERSKATVLTELLPVLDDLDRARSHGDLESGPFKAVADKLTSILEGLGLSAFGDEGDDFDPELHEAVQHEGDGSHPVVGAVMRRGYKVGDFVLRHAMVGVVDTVPDSADTSDNTDESDEKAAES
ncbi:nucleotide exchange factor GrpE [Mycolicibacterium sp. XJ2546]